MQRFFLNVMLVDSIESFGMLFFLLLGSSWLLCTFPSIVYTLIFHDTQYYTTNLEEYYFIN